MFFLYLVKHLDKHEKEGTSQLKLYTDLYLLLMSNPDQILNERLFQNALIVNLEVALAEKLYFLEIFWGITLPEWIRSYTGKIEQDIMNNKFIRFLRNPDENQPEGTQETV